MLVQLSRARELNFARNLHLHPFFVFVNSKGSSETERMMSIV